MSRRLFAPIIAPPAALVLARRLQLLRILPIPDWASDSERILQGLDLLDILGVRRIRERSQNYEGISSSDLIASDGKYCRVISDLVSKHGGPH